MSTTLQISPTENSFAWRVQVAVGQLAGRADQARANGDRGAAEALLLRAWAALEG
jgi:hypothetical protein